MINELFKYEQYGLDISGYEMDNGEHRYRLSSEQSAYIRTESNGTRWQKSHYHTEQTEYYLVEKGQVLFARMDNEKVKVEKYTSGDFFLVLPMTPHNMCLSEGGVTHTVKFGGKPDWNAYPELDRYLKGGMDNE